MVKFEVGKKYYGKTFMGNTCEYECVSRTAKTVTLFDTSYESNFIRKIKTTNETEYVTFSKEFMGWCEMDVYAKEDYLND